MGERETVLLDYYRETADRFRAEAEKLVQSPAKYLDPELSAEPSTGIRLYDRVQRMRAKFVTDFAQRAAPVPPMDYRPTGDSLPDGSLDRNELRMLMTDLDTFVRLLSPPPTEPFNTLSV